VFAERFFEFAKTAGPGCRLRFAPTPSGYLHLGNALNFTLNWLVARLQGGKILLRIDDLDAERKRPEYVADIFESLRWLGLDWDKGPGIDAQKDPVQDFESNWSQHLRLPLYVEVLDRLRAQNVLFGCQKSRSAVAEYGHVYPLEFRHQHLSLDTPDVAWRITYDVQGPIRDFIVRRRDGIPAYQIASFSDDVHFGITHVIRGADLEASTKAQQYLGGLLQESRFSNIHFLHHPLILDQQGDKLSKSTGANSLMAIRAGGGSPALVFEQVAAMLHLPKVTTAADLLDQTYGKFSP
jgi:glutamyl-tRNA synthetase